MEPSVRAPAKAAAHAQPARAPTLTDNPSPILPAITPPAVTAAPPPRHRVLLSVALFLLVALAGAWSRGPALRALGAEPDAPPDAGRTQNERSHHLLRGRSSGGPTGLPSFLAAPGLPGLLADPGVPKPALPGFLANPGLPWFLGVPGPSGRDAQTAAAKKGAAEPKARPAAAAAPPAPPARRLPKPTELQAGWAKLASGNVTLDEVSISAGEVTIRFSEMQLQPSNQAAGTGWIRLRPPATAASNRSPAAARQLQSRRSALSAAHRPPRHECNFSSHPLRTPRGSVRRSKAHPEGPGPNRSSDQRHAPSHRQRDRDCTLHPARRCTQTARRPSEAARGPLKRWSRQHGRPQGRRHGV